ncbi:tyrosine--tRNA ligase [Mycoplasma crocodyli]|uniref:Tyrosine--tRNA ligase n=1 Tax=Mycoplasma crocodyli (strain ATCC 51981 / MP145) TaxID=512564 RepID=D5E4N8_MYCCM|nr:tyrosine--tRNA ligase [Mycoplasma crocodyli]ADE19884.1 tyrosine--tRNA ligase [Mycoplasma crocodyli MP145]
MNILDDLKARGILNNISNEEKFLSLKGEPRVYSGFDPTAKSLHLGNYIVILNLLRFKKYGFKPYALIGGATGMIGDPSFKDSERSLLDEKTVLENKTKIRRQLEKFGLQVVDNYDFYKNMSVLDFLRNVGKLLNVSYMLAKDSVASRIERGLSFTEFSYQLIQGYDFYKLNVDEQVEVQCGGSDQWGNLTAGLEIINKLKSENKAVAVALNLLTDSSGNKFGKSTGGGSLWLDKEMNSPYNLYQFLLNQPDSEVEKLLKWLTLIDINEINKIINKHNENAKLHYAQEVLAFTVVSDVHSKNDAEKAKKLTSILFDKNLDVNTLTIDDIEIMKDGVELIEIKKGQNLVDELIRIKVVSSKREAREFITTNSLKLNQEPVNDQTLVHSKLFSNKFAIIHKGKKQLYLAKIIN